MARRVHAVEVQSPDGGVVPRDRGRDRRDHGGPGRDRRHASDVRVERARRPHAVPAGTIRRAPGQPTRNLLQPEG